MRRLGWRGWRLRGRGRDGTELTCGVETINQTNKRAYNIASMANSEGWVIDGVGHITCTVFRFDSMHAEKEERRKMHCVLCISLVLSVIEWIHLFSLELAVRHRLVETRVRCCWKKCGYYLPRGVLGLASSRAYGEVLML
jgi:hypothetical protein